MLTTTTSTIRRGKKIQKSKYNEINQEEKKKKKRERERERDKLDVQESNSARMLNTTIHLLQQGKKKKKNEME